MSDDERELDLDSDEEASLDYSNLPPGQDKRAHHNALERKRRDHIKDSFSGLKDAIPTLQVRSLLCRLQPSAAHLLCREISPAERKYSKRPESTSRS